MKSIFEDGIIQGGWTGGNTDNTEQLDTSNLAVFRVVGEETPVFQDMIVTSLAEGFVEGESKHDTLGDTFVVFSTGAMPIGITITGYLVRTPEFDSRVDFLQLYTTKLRGTAAELRGTEIEFLFKDSLTFNLAIQNFRISESTRYTNLVPVTITGVGYNYSMIKLKEEGA